MVHFDATKSLGWRSKVTTSEAMGKSAQWVVEDQKR